MVYVREMGKKILEVAASRQPFYNQLLKLSEMIRVKYQKLLMFHSGFTKISMLAPSINCYLILLHHTRTDRTKQCFLGRIN